MIRTVAFDLLGQAFAMRRRALYTEILSMMESGRAKYTYSKMHGVWRAMATHCCA